MRTKETRYYTARCLGCDRTWSGRTAKQILTAGAAARSHCQQAEHRIKGTVLRKFAHHPGKSGKIRKAAK